MRNFTGRLIASSRVRLAVTYLSIIMALSLGFSVMFYTQSVHEAMVNLESQSVELRNYLYFATPEDIQNIQNSQLGVFKKSLVKRLAVLNVGMFLLGGCISIVLAKRSIRPLEDALESQSRFTSDAAHELRTPLTAMKTEIEVTLRSKGLKLSDAKNALKSSLEEIEKLEALTSALLRLAQDDGGSNRSYWRHYRVADILLAAKDRLADEAEGKKVSILLPSTKLTVFGDPDQLVELVVTIFSNAVKYSHSGSVVRVNVSKHGDGWVKLDVVDSGVGITEVDLPHIFERFYRADQSRSRSNAGGYGLGLSLAKSIADTHGGRIMVKSKYSKGSTFTVILPNS